MIASRRLALWPSDHSLGRPGPEQPPSPTADGLISLEWHASARSAASISGAARVGETPTTRLPGFAHTRALRHAAFTCLGVPDDGAADDGIPDATGATCSRSDEDDGTSTNARVPFPDPRDRQETLAGGPVAYSTGPRQAPPDPQVKAAHPALSVARPQPVAGERVPALRYRAQPHRVQSSKASGSCLKTHGAYRSYAGLHSCNCAYEIPQSTTARSQRVDPR